MCRSWFIEHAPGASGFFSPLLHPNTCENPTGDPIPSTPPAPPHLSSFKKKKKLYFFLSFSPYHHTTLTNGLSTGGERLILLILVLCGIPHPINNKRMKKYTAESLSHSGKAKTLTNDFVALMTAMCFREERNRKSGKNKDKVEHYKRTVLKKKQRL